jgi:hypothetical protein
VLLFLLYEYNILLSHKPTSFTRLARPAGTLAAARAGYSVGSTVCVASFANRFSMLFMANFYVIKYIYHSLELKLSRIFSFS